MSEKCGRCHKKSVKLISMGSTSENLIRVCPKCHAYWINHFMSIIDSFPDSWDSKWEEMYLEFRGITVKEKVSFT